MLDTPAPPRSTIHAANDQASTVHGVVLGRHLVAVPTLLPMAGTLRAAVGYLLAEHPRRLDARQVISEFVTTALIENRCTCCPTGQITLTVDCDEHRIRLEISYHLAPTHEPVWRSDWYEDPLHTYGLGLALTNAHADRWGHSSLKHHPPYANDNHTWWAELNHTPRQPVPFSDHP